MRRFIPDIPVALLTGIILSLASCSPESCFEETNAFVKAAMYLNTTGKNVAPDSLTLYGLNINTNKIYNKEKGVSHALLPLNASAASCTFVIKINDIYDTISFGYTSYPHLISKECGYTYYHNIDIPVYTRHIIDTVMVRQSTVTTFNEENIRIFY
jgi:hypothetical protein